MTDVAQNSMFLQWSRNELIKVLSSLNVLRRGQDAASEAHH
jgi:hypothetical protein